MEINIKVEKAELNYYGDCSKGNPKTPEKPKETITIERAQTLYHEYDKRHKVLSDLIDQEEARYGWHSIDFYKDYIAYIEAEAKKNNIVVSGMRLYFAAYPELELDNKNSGVQTYFFVPTYYNEKHKKHIAFDPLHIDENGEPIDIHKVITGNKNGRNKKAKMAIKSMAMLSAETEGGSGGGSGGGTDSSIGNMGEMCKPNCHDL